MTEDGAVGSLGQQEDVWEREYTYLHSIPGSTRESPAKILVRLWTDAPRLPASSLVLDAGCGAGRNALFLARQGYRVHAIDACSAALRIFRQRLLASPESDAVNVQQVMLAPPFPMASNFYHAALDMYVSCHIADEASLLSYWNEIHRVLRPAGLAFAAFFSTDDEYYSPLLDRHVPKEEVVRDPVNGIVKRLYTSSHLQSLFGDRWKLLKFLPLTFPDEVGTRAYMRRVFGLLLQK
jgi:SAM-dependent methyltransferase